MGALKKWRDQQWVRIGTDGSIKGPCGTSKDKKNPDLWRRFLKSYKKHKVSFHWIKGHNEHPQNERCDQLAVKASHREILTIDVGYEAQEKDLFE